jgi:hypothetical protein
MASEGNCTLLIAPADKVGLPSQAELVAELESTDVQRKSAALKKAILMLLSGEDMPRMLMTVIRYCITVEDHTLQASCAHGRAAVVVAASTAGRSLARPTSHDDHGRTPRRRLQHWRLSCRVSTGTARRRHRDGSAASACTTNHAPRLLLSPCPAPASQKLLMLYYEVARKHDAAGKLLPEMILVWCVGGAVGLPNTCRRTRACTETRPRSRVCRHAHLRHDAAAPRPRCCSNALRNNLISPNEYIRGCTLRFLTKLREPELLESLIPSIKACLAHRHPYVRRNAVLAVFTIYRAFPDLFPDAPEQIEKFMEEVSSTAECEREAMQPGFAAVWAGEGERTV